MRPVLPVMSAVAAMASFQVGAALSKGLFPAAGPQGAAALRLSLGAILLLLLVRPWRRWPRQAPRLPLFMLGLSMAGVILALFMALERLPLGVAIAIQFLGPLTIALCSSRRAVDLLWAALAAFGVWNLLRVGQELDGVDPVGILWALCAAAGWAAYILLAPAATKTFGGSTAALAVTIAAALVLPIGVHHAGPALFAPTLLPLALVVALLSTAVPFSLEMYSLPRLPARTFAVLMSLEPAFAALLGLVVLGERLVTAQVAGVGAVVLAAAGAAWSGSRHE